MNDQLPHYDLVGVGLGPFNLSLAALLEPHLAGGENLKALFLEQKTNFDWHPGMILPGTTLQVPFLADLVSMADPTSPYSFLNYLHHKQRLYKFYFYENFQIFRREYVLYCRWVSEQLGTLRFGKKVIGIKQVGEEYLVNYEDLANGAISTVRATNLVLGYGSKPYIPPAAREFLGEGVYHTASFLENKTEFMNSHNATVIGSGQSAGECFLDILKSHQPGPYNLSWFTRGDGFLPMEYSKLGLEHFSPEYIDYFHGLSTDTRDRVREGQDLWYKGMADLTISQIYDSLYELELEEEKNNYLLCPKMDLTGIRRGREGGFELFLRHRDQDRELVHQTDTVLLGTGYSPATPEFLSELLSNVATDETGRFQITRDYKLIRNTESGGDIYIQNGEIHSHGIGAPDLGLGAYRSATIVNDLLKRPVYSLYSKNVFQNFGIQAMKKPAYQEMR